MFSAHDVTAAILVFQNKETLGSMLVYLTNRVGLELFSYLNPFFCFNTFTWLLIVCVADANNRTGKFPSVTQARLVNAPWK